MFSVGSSCSLSRQFMLAAVLIVPFHSVLAAYSGGTGDPNDPWRIATPADMVALSDSPEHWDGHFVLAADLDMVDVSECDYKQVGSKETPFAGVFDGRAHVIENYHSTRTPGCPGPVFTRACDGCETGVKPLCRVTGLGVFGRVGPGAEIFDVHMRRPVVRHNCDYVGALVGYLDGGTVRNCSVVDGDIRGYSYAGGMVGAMLGAAVVEGCQVVDAAVECETGGGLIVGGVGTINLESNAPDACVRGCSASGVVSVARYGGGGLTGFNSGTIARCSSIGSVLGGEESCNVGGLVGDNRGTLRASFYAGGRVTGTEQAGGLVGLLTGSGRVLDCYATGEVQAAATAGGLVGGGEGIVVHCWSGVHVQADEGAGELAGFDGFSSNMIVSSYWDVERSGQKVSCGGVGLTTGQMQSAGSFGYWYGDVWTIQDGLDYPRLAWQQLAGDAAPSRDFAEGTGTADDPWRIAGVDDYVLLLNRYRDWDGHFRLTADLDLADVQVHPIGWENQPFTGVFDGGGHAVRNFTYDPKTRTVSGLFGIVDAEDARIENVTLIDPCVGGDFASWVGSLAGVLRQGRVVNCHAVGGRVSANEHGIFVGGLVGAALQASLHDCSVEDVTVLGTSSVGGLAGGAQVYVMNCRASARVTAMSSSGGGLCGDAGRSSVLIDCSSASQVVGGNMLGGLVGSCDGWVERCTAFGSVRGEDQVGGLIGRLGASRTNGTAGVISQCSSAAAVEGADEVGGLIGSCEGLVSDCRVGEAGVDGSNDVGGLIGRVVFEDYFWDTEPIVPAVERCLTLAPVVGTDAVGAAVGWNDGGRVAASFWNADTAGLPACGGGDVAAVEAYGLGGGELRAWASYAAAGWDLVGETANGEEDIWGLCENTNCPRLAWSIPAADFLCPNGVAMEDLAAFAGAWVGELISDERERFDLQPDGRIDIHDLRILARQWLTGR